MRVLLVIVVSIVVGGAFGLLAGAFAEDRPVDAAEIQSFQ
jgi:hypothetical protein